MTTTREHILQTGRALIMSRGYTGFSYADVAEVVGVRKASIHHHFPAKSDLARAVVAQSRIVLTSQAEALAAAGYDPLQQLRLYTGFWEQCIRDGSASFCVAAILAAEAPALPADLLEEVQTHFQVLSDWLERVLEQGAGAGRFALALPAKVEAQIFMSTVYGAMLTARAYGEAGLFATIVEGAFARLAPIASS
ncbi:TetR/AcrR family transcriptional regulator [Caulobacter sp. S45]|uniref:TetR/AcrR family transcriptional regulator n=1 Tax=Caulobacter sp. S45 TaxID=1641861 RepID=UPI0015756E83|nr:TetR/AcrR family transcriptional regulator [Caulobacter sp. S45]